MKDIYNRSLFDENAVQHVPDGYIDGAANSLYKFLGSFWHSLHQGDSFVRGLQNVRGIKVAQFYLDLLETLKLQNRRGIPVFHRELWKPLVIRKSQRNTAQENVLKIGGGDKFIGEQPTGSIYGHGTTLQIGSLANLDGYVTYPVDAEIETIVSGISNSVVNPTVVYTVGQAFPDTEHDVCYVNGTLIFPVDKDPFADGSGFDPYDVSFDETDPSASPDSELVVWASDVLIDKNYISDHMAYALGVSCNSSEIAKRVLNAGWDALNCGLTPAALRTLVAALANVPVIQESSERVKYVETLADGTRNITTDAHVYSIHARAELRDCIKGGAVLRRGEFLDKSIKVYPFISDLSDEKLAHATEYADIFKQDVPVISIPRTILRTGTASGIAVDWKPVDVLDSGKVDRNGHRKLYFDVAGSERDVDRFWEDVWSNAEERNVDLDDVFSEYDVGSSSSWQISPAEFFLETLLGMNTLIVTVDRRQIGEDSTLHDPMFFKLLSNALPSGIRLFMVEHLTEDEGDAFDAGVSTDETAEKFAYADAEDELYYEDLPGMRGRHQPTYEDAVEIKFIRDRRRTAE